MDRRAYEDKDTTQDQCTSKATPVTKEALPGVVVPNPRFTGVYAVEEVEEHKGEEDKGDALENQAYKEDLSERGLLASVKGLDQISEAYSGT